MKAGALEEIGTVIRKHPNSAQIAIGRKEACNGCHSCLFNETRQMMIAEAVDPLGVSIGDVVKIRASGKSSSSKAGFILYIIPLLLFIGGYLIGDILSKSFGFNTESEFMGFLAGILIVAFYYLSVFVAGRAFKSNRKNSFTVTEIIGRPVIHETEKGIISTPALRSPDRIAKKPVASTSKRQAKHNKRS